MSKVPSNEANAKQCNCPNCPTYQSNDCPKTKGELLYCGRGKTACDLPDKGCVCGLCPIFKQYGLTDGYYCFTGEAK